jgi:hypothetical protein
VSALSKLEVLVALLSVLERQDADRARAVAERGARVATDEEVLAAIGAGEDTWERLHAFFPESQLGDLGRVLDRLQRSERAHRDERLRFRVGARRARWVLA